MPRSTQYNLSHDGHLRLPLVLLACVFLTFLPFTAFSQPFSYAVGIQVPETYRTLLEDHLDIIRWRNDPNMNANQLRQVYLKTPDAIRALLETEGYYAADVTANLELKEDKWQANFKVDPGEPVRVERFDLIITGDFVDDSKANDERLEKLRNELPLRTGSVFRQGDWEDSKRAVLKNLLIDRYPTATIVSSLATVDPETRTAQLALLVSSGPPFTFGALKITGLERYPRTIIEHLNTTTPGMPYSQARLLDFQAQLQNTPYFTSAIVSINADPVSANQTPVLVDVVEKPAQKIGLGVGVSTNTGTRGQIEYQNINFLNSAWRLTSLLKLETLAQQLNAEIQVPRTSWGYHDSANIFSERDDIEGAISVRYGIGAKRARAIGKLDTALEIQFQTERLRAGGTESIQQQALTLNYSWSHRDLDNALYPTRGLELNAQVGGGSKALLSTTDFARGYAKLVYFHPVGKSGVAILRVEGGAVTARSREGVPSDFMFRTGGDQSVRGFAYQSLGVNEAWAVLGGRYLGVASIEYMKWLRPNFGASVFFDAGDAADDPQGFTPYHGYGIGLRWRSPVGPLNLDLAHGREIGKTRLHFSVGFAF